jgi:hypothetical protein
MQTNVATNGPIGSVETSAPRATDQSRRWEPKNIDIIDYAQSPAVLVAFVWAALGAGGSKAAVAFEQERRTQRDRHRELVS